AEISHESPGSSQCLLEHLLTRLQSSSCHVKLKVLKILLHTCSQGSPQFVLQLKRNAGFIREAAVFSGPPDPLHGNSLNQKVRAAAQDLASVLFSDAPLPQPLALPARAPAGMGSSPSPCGSLQGFGFSGDRSGPGESCPGPALPWSCARALGGHSVPCPRSSPSLGARHALTPPLSAASTGEALLSSLQRAAEAVAQASCSGVGGPWLLGGAGSVPDPRRGEQVSPVPSRRVPSRVDADSPGDCRREVSLVSGLTRGARVFLTREEAQHFLKECGLLNCEVVLELLGRALEDPSDSVRMVSTGCPSQGGWGLWGLPSSATIPFLQRSMSALSALGCSDLLSPEQIFAVTRQHLQQLSQGSPGPVANRATKMLRQFEALCRAQPSPRALLPSPPPPAGDLLMDCPALAGESILTPLSPSPGAPPAPG
ncbi:AP4AT protein, partial [Tyrannus savana]|nr:AP4AT protein [Tyrannus savana]